MTRKYVGLALGVGAIVLAVSGCQSDAGGAGKASDSASTTAPATPLDAVRTPAVVTSAPTATVPTSLLSKKWGPKLDAVMDELKVCAPGRSPACAAAVALAYQAAKGFESDTLVTGTEGRYVHAKPEARKVTGAGAFYALYKCGSKTPEAADELCEQRVLKVISGTVMLKTEIARDERDARAGLAAGATPSATPGGSTPGATMPPAPVGALRDGYLNGLAVVNIWLVHDPDRAVDNGRRQCQALDRGGSDDVLAHQAAERFGSDGADLTDADGKTINQYLRQVLCPTH